jgi:hypothetical protein
VRVPAGNCFRTACSARDGRRYNERSIKVRKANLLQFTNLSGNSYVEQYTRANMLHFKEFPYTREKLVAAGLGTRKTIVLATWRCHMRVAVNTSSIKSWVRQPEADWSWSRLSVQMG